MKIQFLKVAAVAVTCVLFQSPAFAGDQDFEVVNKTGYALKHLYVSEGNNNSWDEDVLGRDVLNDGESFELTFGKRERTCKWDLKVVYDDGESAVWEDLNLCKISKLTLRWNKSTGVTTAVVD